MDQTLAKPKILVVEDERDIRELILLHLRREGYDIVAAENGERALEVITPSVSAKFNLLILDWMLPGISGLEICKRLRASGETSIPILMVTARTDASDIVLGLEMGADDYITKPFEIPVLMARVRALLRRSGVRAEATQEVPTVFELGSLRIDTAAYKVHSGKEEIALTPSEFKLLVALAQNQGRVLSREKLIDLVQGEGVAVVDRTIDTHVFGLRKKLGTSADVIETIRGIGYRVK